MLLINAVKHFCLITKHRWVVFKLCTKIGMPIRGLLHDLSKYSPTEFFEGVKYYNGKRSPISVCKEKNEYSKAWLHHKGRNKHHSEYWVDFTSLPVRIPVIPYKYTAEMICDRLAASITYNGKNFNSNMPLEYWNKEKEILKINDKIKQLLQHVFTEISKNGIDKTLTRKNIKLWYNKYCIEGENDENKI